MLISQIRKRSGYEGKVVRKMWEDSNKYPIGQFKKQQKVGGHFVGKSSDQNQARGQNLEGKGGKGAGNGTLELVLGVMKKAILHSNVVKIKNLYHKK